MAIQPGVGYTFTTSSQGETFNVTQPWSLYAPLIDNGAWNPTDNCDDTFSLSPGTINGVIPCCDGTGVTRLITQRPSPKIDYDWGTAVSGYQKCYIYLQAGPASGSGGLVWPEADIGNAASYPTIYGYPDTMEDDDDSGYLLLALAQKETATGTITFDRFVTTSVWSERHKYSQPDSAYYYFYRV